MTPDDYYTAWKDKPGPATLTPLLSSVAPTIGKALKSYGYQDDPNVRSSAQLHVIKVLPNYDASKAKLETFLTNELKRVQRFAPRQQHAVAMPEGAALDLKQINSAELELTDDLGREPTVDELADYTRLSSRRIARIKQRYGLPTVSEQVFSRGRMPGGEAPGAPTVNPNDELWLDAVYGELDPVNQKILDWAMGRHDQPILSKTQMAQRLNMSVSAVTQRSIHIANKIEEGANYRVL